MTAEDSKRAQEQAKTQLESIRELVVAYRAADDLDEPERSSKLDAAREAILEDPLSIEVRSGWHTPGAKGDTEEYRILLCTGGPAVQIVGDLSGYGEPETAHIEYQDWFTPWQRLSISGDDERDLLTYAQTFYFGE